MTNLDSDLLRTFLAVAQAGSVTDGAARIHRSQSATSIQLRRLEEILGQPVFERHRRGATLNDAGRLLLPVTQDVTARLDAALREVSHHVVQGKLRVGIPDDHSQTKLARIIASFSRHHPKVELEVTCALSAGFPDALEHGRLDLAIYEVERPEHHEELLFEDPTCWVTSTHHGFPTDGATPVALFDHACWWRDVAFASLEARTKPYRVAYSSQSVSGVIAAVEAGIAIGLLGRSSLRASLSVIGEHHGFGPTPASKLVMASGVARHTAPLQAMKSAIRSAFLEGS